MLPMTPVMSASTAGYTRPNTGEQRTVPRATRPDRRKVSPIGVGLLDEQADRRTAAAARSRAGVEQQLAELDARAAA